MNNKKLPFFEDFKVGDQFREETIEVTTDMIKKFALEFDPQPIHLDEQAGKASIFGGLTGSGWHTAALTMKLMERARPFGERPIIGIEVQNFKFKAPLKPGDTLAVKSEIIKAWRSKTKPIGFCQVAVSTANQEGIEILSQAWTVILPTKD